MFSYHYSARIKLQEEKKKHWSKKQKQKLDNIKTFFHFYNLNWTFIHFYNLIVYLHSELAKKSGQ